MHAIFRDFLRRLNVKLSFDCIFSFQAHEKIYYFSPLLLTIGLSTSGNMATSMTREF